MKQFLVFLMILVMALPAFAQRRPRWPDRRDPHPRTRIPRPMPRYSCQVVMVDRYNRVVNRYWGRTAGRSGRCQDALRECSWDLRRYGSYGNRCAQVW